MRNLYHFMVLVLIVSLIFIAHATASERITPKIRKCLKEKECRFVVTNPSTPDPKMSFLVLDKVWKSFHDGDRDHLREMLNKKIREANDKPEKYVRVSKKSPSYDAFLNNIKNMRSYSVLISYKKSRSGDLQQDEEIMVNY
ncbi:MAG: hypothetical protein NT010_00035 [Proteobacteria bacterium]|nr:hypothetical protein [Pseudomonadota bacterium]